MVKQDEELDKLEDDIRRLKNRYDQFFTGIAKVPPTFERTQVEAFIHEMGKQKMRDSTRRFRFNTILSRYNQFRELWGRKMRTREEGPLDFRSRQAALASEQKPAPAESEPRPRSVTSQGADPYVKVTTAGDGEPIRKLLDAIERENAKLGKASNLSVEQLAAMVEKQSELVRSKYKVSSVAFRVETIDGKVKLKAKPVQD